MNRYEWITGDMLLDYINKRQPDGKHNHIIDIIKSYCEMLEMEKAIHESRRAE